MPSRRRPPLLNPSSKRLPSLSRLRKLKPPLPSKPRLRSLRPAPRSPRRRRRGKRKRTRLPGLLSRSVAVCPLVSLIFSGRQSPRISPTPPRLTRLPLRLRSPLLLLPSKTPLLILPLRRLREPRKRSRRRTSLPRSLTPLLPLLSLLLKRLNAVAMTCNEYFSMPFPVSHHLP